MKRLTHSLSLCVLLAACGGGGGGGGDDDGNGGGGLAPSGPTLNITSSNAKAVASEVLDANTFMLGVGTGLGITSLSAQSADSRFNLESFLEDQINSAAFGKSKYKTTANRVITGNNSIMATETVTEPCDAGGSVTVVVNDVDNNDVLSRGDTASAEYQNCNDGEFIYNGKSSLEFLLVEGDIENEIPPYRFQVKTVLDDLGVTDCCQSGSDSFSVNGDITMTLNQPDSSNTSTTLQGDSLRVVTTGTESGTVTLKTYLLEASENASTGVFSLSVKGMLDSTLIGGSVSFDTPQTFVGGLNDENPSSGVMVINGANGSKETLTVIDNARVELAVDANGDGINETTIPVTWDELVE